MVSITNVGAGQAGHYYAKDNYYSCAEGAWQGKGAAALGLSGEVNKESFLSLIHGKSPDGSESLVSYEPRFTNGQEQKPRAGVDLTFSAPKSVSILSEVLGDKTVREAHDKAVSTALSLVEKQYSQARVTVNGQTEKVNTGNLVIAKFNHSTSRELDPHLHTHSVVLNLTERQDGSFRALSNEQLYSNKMFIGLAYRSELAANLKELGYSIKTDDKGLFEIAGFDQKLLDHFSRRSGQIEASAKDLQDSGKYSNADPQRLREIACLGSRVAKRDVNLDTVKEAWTDRLKDQGFSREQLQGEVQIAAQNIGGRADSRQSPSEYIRAATRIVTEQESVFRREDILKAAGKLALGDHRMTDLDKAFSRAVQNREVVSLDKGQGIFTTREMQGIERNIVRMVRDKTSDPIAPKEFTHRELDQYERSQRRSTSDFAFSKGQRAAAEHILTTNSPALIQGNAGTGKTTVLDAVRIIAEKQGYEVKGLSFTGKAAEEIENASGIKSQTLHSFLSKETGHSNAKQLWVIDEASMVGSRQMHRLLQEADKAKAKVVFLGDTKQLQSIEAGKMFYKLQDMGIKTVEMNETLRQKDEEYKEIVNDISLRKIDSAFERLNDKSRICEIADPAELKTALIQDYIHRKNHKDAIIVTPLNKDRREINQAIRAGLKGLGKLSNSECEFTTRESKGLNPEEKHFAQQYSQNDIVTVNKAGMGIKVGAEGRVLNADAENHSIIVLIGDKERSIDLNRHGDKISAYQEQETAFTKGDKVVFLKNDKSLHVQNGLTGTIDKLSENGDVTVRLGNGQDVSFNLKSQYNYLDHGYAVTDFKSQGQTSKEVIYHAETANEQKNTFNSFYVAVTRGKEDVRIYTDNSETLKDQVKHEQQKSSTLDYAREDSGREDNSPSDKSSELPGREYREDVKEIEIGQ